MAFGGSHARAAHAINRKGASNAELLLAVRRAGGGFASAALLTRSPGKTAMLVVAPAQTSADREAGARLIRTAISCAGQLNAALVQALVEPAKTDELTMFASGGMSQIGVLSYLERRPFRGPDPSSDLPPAGVCVRPWREDERETLERLLDATYIDSLDCPGLAQMRCTEDILDGHLQTGVFDPNSWSILERNGTPCGLSLMSEIPTSNCVELVYFGLAPEARGRGLGGYLLDTSLCLVQTKRDRTIALACDERNQPAMRLYRSRGFVERLRRVALVARVERSPDPDPTTCPRSVDN